MQFRYFPQNWTHLRSISGLLILRHFFLSLSLGFIYIHFNNIFIFRIYSSSFINIFLPKNRVLSCWLSDVSSNIISIVSIYMCMKGIFLHVSFTPSFIKYIFKATTKKLKKAKAMWGVRWLKAWLEGMKPRNS